MPKEVLYKKLWLQRGSTAYELYFSKEQDAKKKLDAHIKQIYDNYAALTGKV